MKRLCIIAFYTVLLSCTTPAQQKDVTVASFEEDINKPDVQLLDVRTAGEFKAIRYSSSTSYYL